MHLSLSLGLSLSRTIDVRKKRREIHSERSLPSFEWSYHYLRWYAFSVLSATLTLEKSTATTPLLRILLESFFIRHCHEIKPEDKLMKHWESRFFQELSRQTEEELEKSFILFGHQFVFSRLFNVCWNTTLLPRSQREAQGKLVTHFIV